MKYLPFSSNINANVFRHEMGLKTLDLSQWIDVDENWRAHTDLKAQLLNQNRDKVFQAEDTALEASHELKQLLAQHLTQYFPQIPLTEDPLEHPLVNLSRWVQEDFCLLTTQNNKEARLEAGCVCFPSRWKLIEKVGKNMQGIHQPVPGFNATLEKPSTRFLLNTTEDKPMWRLNWTLHTSDEMFAYPEVSQTSGTFQFDGSLDEIFLRVERQTLRRLPKTQSIVFTIRTYVEPLANVLKSDQDYAALLLQLETMPAEVIRYKGLTAFIEPLKQKLKNKGT